MNGMTVAAFDPGRNIGFALVTLSGELLQARILQSAELPAITIEPGVNVVMGGGTGSGTLLEALNRLGHQVTVVDEEGTSLAGRELYFRDNPPGLPWRLLPRTMWSPPRPIDDYAAYAIALRHLGLLPAALQGTGRRPGALRRA